MSEKTSLHLAYLIGYEDRTAGRLPDQSKAESLAIRESETTDEPKCETCRIEYIHGGPLFDVWRYTCCGHEHAEPRCVQGYTDLPMNFCPNCGAKVVDE